MASITRAGEDTHPAGEPLRTRRTWQRVRQRVREGAIEALRARLQERVPDPRRPWWAALAGIAAVCLVAAGVAGLAVRSRGPAQPRAAGVASVRLAPVTRGPLSSIEQVSGTVEYATSYSIVNQSQGVYTDLPAVGQVVHQGQALYAVNGNAVVLLYGSVPAYRNLFPGETGADVAALNADLVALGYASHSQIPHGSATFTPATATALERLQAHLGLTPSATLPLGGVVFLPESVPESVTVATVTPSIGAGATTGQTVLQATSTTLEVVSQVDASQQSVIHAGQRATITLADGKKVPGKVAKVAMVATAPSSSAGGSGGSSSGSSSATASGAPENASTVEVDVTPDQPGALGKLDNASVEVGIATASVRHALSVPVTALLAQPGGRYAVEVVEPKGEYRLVPVQLGLFDDAAGRVQVIGTALHAGEQVAVAGT